LFSLQFDVTLSLDKIERQHILNIIQSCQGETVVW